MPVLVGGAQPPDEDQLPEDLRDLPRRQAHELTDTRWDYDIDRLINAIESIGIKARSPSHQESFRQRLRIGAAVLATIAIVLQGMLAPNFATRDAPGTTPNEDGQQDRPGAESQEVKRENMRAPAESIPTIVGLWRDIDNTANTSEITLNSNSFEFHRWGVLPNGMRFESSGSGTLTTRHFTSYYNATYQTGMTSTDDCFGTVSLDGTRLEMNCRDSLLGAFPVMAIRQ